MAGLKTKMLACALAGVSLSTGGGSARADDQLLPERTDVAGTRAQPDFDPVDVRFGAWTASPAVRVDLGYDSNLFGSSGAPVGDGFAIVSPQFGLRGDWAPARIDLSARGTLTRYIHHPRQHSDEYALQAGGALALGRFTVSPSVSDSLVSERKSAAGTPLATGRPSQYRLTGQRLQFSGNLAPLLVGLSVSHDNLHYNDLDRPDGTILSQRFRDAKLWSVRAQATYQPSDIAAVGVSVNYQHGENRVSARTNDETTYQTSAAIDTGMFRIDGALGYLRHEFANPALRDFNGLVYSGSVRWYLTPLLTLGLNGRKQLESSGVSTVGVIRTRAWRAEADYELLRNLLLHADYSERYQKFSEIGTHTVSRAREINGEYKFNRTVSIGAYARRECRDSSDTSLIRRFCVSLAGLSLTYR